MTNKITQFLNTIIPTISEKASKLVDVSLLIEKSWFFLNDFSTDTKVIYLFSHDNELLISKNGVVSIGKWKSVVHSTSSLLLTIDSNIIFYNIIFLNFEYLILQQDGTSKYLFFAKQEKYSFCDNIDSFNLVIENYIKDIKLFLNSHNSTRFNLPEMNIERTKKNEPNPEIKAQKVIFQPEKTPPPKRRNRQRKGRGQLFHTKRMGNGAISMKRILLS